ncbi:MAG: thiol peroxidase [Candidatus Fermentibacteraceae bacterium]|nr:thiol peroxidase [Candidatus Fermentibacteraceae bacterium]MBN2608580.1 thiol peroxidase [Candidatus Fermentibacteraceae bacterium]
MATVTLKGDAARTVGELPDIGSRAPDFELVGKGLEDMTLSDFRGFTVLMNIFPSLDTPVCAMSVRRFNSESAGLPGVRVLCISADLPFAHGRFCETEGIENVVNLSSFRSPDFGMDYGVSIMDGPLRGLLARAVIVVDPDGMVVYRQLVPEISSEPDYEQVLSFLGNR